MGDPYRNPQHGRGAQTRVPNRYEPLALEVDWEHLTDEDIAEGRADRPRTEFLEDQSQSIISENRSPDIPFRYSLNPYRGCEHGCSYCYARPSHEFLGFSPALDFETKILVKPRAAELFRQWLARAAYRPETVVFSGVTDCYQPVERKLRLTRACLEVATECRQPIGVVTKNAGVTRDLELLAQLAAHNAACVALSIPTLNVELSRRMEPRTSTPEARLRAIERLSAAGIPTQVMVAPVIPGLTDSEIPAVLKAAREAGATTAGYTLLRLPAGVRQVFLGWIDACYPQHTSRVEALVRSTREGKLNCADFGQRMRGEGAYADQIAQTFRAFKQKLGYAEKAPPLDASGFLPPRDSTGQQWLF
ncbi:MAG: PA0069 family radical SAM protein [Planctomycetales bacterium]|nr:PA0069 family radical SAM protein [Planctomycetales bacterium]